MVIVGVRAGETGAGIDDNRTVMVAHSDIIVRRVAASTVPDDDIVGRVDIYAPVVIRGVVAVDTIIIARHMDSVSVSAAAVVVGIVV